MIKLAHWLIAIPLAINLGCAAGAESKANEPKDYLTKVAKRLRNNYFPPPGTEASRAIVSFTLECSGAASGIKIAKPPLLEGHRMALADRALLMSVKNAVPLPKPPACLHCPKKLSVTFDGTDTSKPFTCKVETSDHRWSSDAVGYTGKSR